MRIAYGVCGEGKGHAGRAMTLIEALLEKHEVDIFTFGEAYELFSLAGGFSLHKVDGLNFSLNKDGAVDGFGSLKALHKLYRQSKQNIEQIVDFSKNKGIDLFLTDFEPFTIRAAKECGKPCISIDNQHKFLMRQRGLPLSMNLYACFAGAFTGLFIPRPSKAIITTFHHCDSDSKRFIHTEVMIRKQYTKLLPVRGNHVLVYIKPSIQDKVLEAIKNIPEFFIIYGTAGVESSGNFEIRKTSYMEFGYDLASCKAVIACAGNQLLGEAKYFGKPVFAIPFPKQDEQLINGWWVKQGGGGDFSKLKDLTQQHVEHFLRTEYSIKRVENGVDEVLKILKPYLE